MRVAFLSNIANYSYRAAKALREQTDLDVHLYLDDKTPLAALPESDDPEYKDHYPAWIHKGDLYQVKRLYPIALPFTAPVVRELRSFDLIIVSGEGPMYAQFTGKPYCFLVSGGDVTVRPFPLRYRFWTKPKPYNLIASVFMAYWQRRGIRRAAEIWAQPFHPYRDPLYEIGVDPARIKPAYFPIIINTERFKADENLLNTTDNNIRQIREKYDFVLFCPSRLMIEADPRLRAIGQWKANDVLIKGFAQFVQRSGVERAGLVMPDVTISPDIPLAKALIRDLGIEAHVCWAKAPRPEAFTRDELAPYYMLADAVADDFGVGWFGGVVLEGMAFSRPVINYIDEGPMSQLYPWHPILSANTPEGVADHLLMLYTHPERGREIGLKGRQWIEEFHSPEKASQSYILHITELIQRFSVR